MELPVNDVLVHLERAWFEHEETLSEYCRIASGCLISDADADQLSHIYAQAEVNPWLNFFICEFDYFINQRSGLLSERHVCDYDNQQAWLREHLQEMPFDEQYRKEMQTLLKEFNYYSGPIDGVLGQRSKKAIEKMHKKAQKLLAKKGFYREPIDGIFADYSVMAVKDFQKSENLRDDGILRRETLERLMK